MSTSSNAPLAICLFVGAVSFNAIKDGISKLLSAEITPVTFLSIQYIFLMIILFIPISFFFGNKALIPPKIWLQLLRGASACLGVGFYYWSVGFIHIADAIAVVFVSPLIVTALSPLLLGERPLGLKRIIAIIIGFCGVIIILQPSFTGKTPGYLIALCSGVFISFFYLLNRKLAPESPLICSVFHTALCASFFLKPYKSDPTTLFIRLCYTFSNWPDRNGCRFQISRCECGISFYLRSNYCGNSSWLLSIWSNS